MTRITVFSLTALFTVSVLSLPSGNAQAGWTEDFESYPNGLLTSAPWNEGVPEAVNATEISADGYTGNGLVNTGQVGAIWRAAPNSGVTQLTARLYSDNATYESFSRYYVGLHTQPIADGGGHAESDYVTIYLSSYQNDNFFSLEYSDFEDVGGVQTFQSPAGVYDRADDTGTGVGILGDTWYDVRLTLNGDNTVTGEYKLTTEPTVWTEIGDGIEIGDPSGFSPNYVGVRGENAGRIDDISVNGVIPEPSSMALILVGLAARGWRRRQTLER